MSPPAGRDGGPVEWRANVGGSQRAIRVAGLYLGILVALYLGFLLYDRTAPGGGASPEVNGVLVFTGLFAAFAVVGFFSTLTPAPRGAEVTPDRVTVVGRWGRRRSLPSLDGLYYRVVRRYPEGWLSDTPVELIELWGKGIPVLGYLVDSELFRGAVSSEREL